MAELAASAFAALSGAFATSATAAGTAGSIGAAAGATAGAGAMAGLGGAGAALGAGATAAGAAGTATGLAGAGSGFLSALQGVTTVGSMVSSLFAGGAGLMQGIRGARMADINARSEQLSSEAKAIEIQRDLVTKIGNNRVAYAAAGLDVSSGAAIEEGLQGQAKLQTAMADSGGDMAAVSQRMRGQNLALQGYSSLVAGAGKALATGTNYALDVSKRG